MLKLGDFGIIRGVNYARSCLITLHSGLRGILFYNSDFYYRIYLSF